MVCGQILIVQFGGAAFQVTPINIIQWVICVVLGFLSIPVGIIIRLIPTNFHSTSPPPAVNIDLEKEWSDTIMQVQNQLHFFKTLRGGRFRAHFGDKQEKSETRSKAIAAAAMLPSLISASVGVHMTREQSSSLDLGRQLRIDDNEGMNSSSASKNQNDTNVDTIDVQKDEAR
jgi:Ca2+-transporting ATPase